MTAVFSAPHPWSPTFHLCLPRLLMGMAGDFVPASQTYLAEGAGDVMVSFGHRLGAEGKCSSPSVGKSRTYSPFYPQGSPEDLGCWLPTGINWLGNTSFPSLPFHSPMVSSRTRSQINHRSSSSLGQLLGNSLNQDNA